MQIYPLEFLEMNSILLRILVSELPVLFLDVPTLVFHRNMNVHLWAFNLLIQMADIYYKP